MKKAFFVAMVTLLMTVVAGVNASHASLVDVQRAYQTGQYFSAARMAFNEATHVNNAAEKAQAYAWTTLSLVGAGLDQSAFYFFVRTLQQKDRNASRMVLDLAPLFMERVGPDLLKKFMTQNTGSEDYSADGKSAYWLVVAKDRLLKSDFNGVIQAANLVQRNHALFPVAMQIRGTANALLKRPEAALQDFKVCVSTSSQRRDDPAHGKAVSGVNQEKWIALKRDAAMDLQARCYAGQARVLYEMEKYEESDRMYDEIPKASFVWTDTLFEHAWATFGKQEYNRTLGKLVSYKSPALKFVFNSEVEVLRAQAYLTLCLYADAQVVIEEFNRKYGIVAKEIKDFVGANGDRVASYYSLGKKALLDKLHTENPTHRFLNRFVRSPYFQSLALSEDRVASEKNAISRMDASRPETATGMNAGFPGFLNQVLEWRMKTIQELGGIFVKNSILDYHQVLINDFEKMQFMKIDLLAAMKRKLQATEIPAGDRQRGNRVPFRRDDQLLWSFNGEFWNDEIGDYVFALNSECENKEASQK